MSKLSHGGMTAIDRPEMDDVMLEPFHFLFNPSLLPQPLRGENRVTGGLG